MKLESLVLVTLLFVAVATGMFIGFNQWFSDSGSTAHLNNSGFNQSKVNDYFGLWGFNASTGVSKAQPVSFGGSDFFSLTGVFQIITLTVGWPNFIFGIFSDIAAVLGLAPWFVSVAGLFIIIIGLFAVINGLRGGG